MLRIVPVLASAAFLLLAGCAQTDTRPRAAAPVADSAAERFVAGVKRTVLPNGLTVLVREQKGSGIVAVNTWVKAGYFHEPDEVAGMAHLFEHMFFKGSRKYPGPEAIAEAVSAAGGSTNAGTIYTYTSYYVVVPKEQLAAAIEIQADAIAHPLFDPGELKKEAEVVIEESNRKLDNPGPTSFERMIATSFTRHRIKRWRIGSNEVLRNIRRDHLIAFFDTLYRPENIIVTIAGDLDAAEALRLAQRTYGTIPRGQSKKEAGPREPAQAAFRFGRSEADIKEGYTQLGWHTVPENHADEVTLEVLAGLLGQGRSARFYGAVVGPGGASTANAGHFTFDDVGLFFVSSTHPEANRAEVERRILVELERMKRFGPTDYELARAKNIAEVNFLREIDTALGQAQALAEFEARGSYRDIAAKLARIKTVSAAEVRAAAQRYLTVEKMTLYHYQPKGSPAVAEQAALERVRRAAASEVAAPEAVALPAAESRVGPASADAAAPQAFRLSNGATLVVRERTGTPMIATGIFFRGGRTQETAANAGITRLMQAVMRRGTATRGGAAIDRELEFLGTQVGTTTWDDGFGFTFDSPGRFYEPALSVFADLLTNPTFPEGEIAREKGLQVAALRRSMDSAIERPLQIAREALYPGHPYGLNERGTEKTIAAIDRAALQAWWKSTLAADRALIVVVGNAAAEDVRRAMEEKLAALPRAAGALPPVPAVAPPAAPREAIERRDRKQTAMVVAFPAVPPAHPDWHALRLLTSVTSGLSGTFFRQLRSREQLAYVVFARPDALAAQAAFVGYLAGDAAKEATARASLLRELRNLQGEGITEADLARAKSYFAGNTRINRERSANLAAEYGRNYVLDVPLDHVDRTLAAVPGLRVQDMRDVARRYFAGDGYVYAAVRGDPAAAR